MRDSPKPKHPACRITGTTDVCFVVSTASVSVCFCLSFVKCSPCLAPRGEALGIPSMQWCCVQYLV